MIITTTIIILLIAIICTLSYVLYRNIIVQESLEEINTDLLDTLNNINDALVDVETQLHEIDIRGAFEANDQVGFVFKEIKRLIMELNDTRNG